MANETHSPIGSRSSTPIPPMQTNGDPGDSGFGMEDVDALESRNLSPISAISENELSLHLSVASDSDYSVSSRSNLSDADDTTEISYFKNITQDLNSNNSPVVSKYEDMGSEKIILSCNNIVNFYYFN